MSPWKFDQAECRLSRDYEVAQLTPKAAAVLGCLLKRKGAIVSKEDMLEEVWSGLNVTEDLIREYVFDIRAALGDDARNPAYIETVRGKGFRLIGGIERAAPSGTTHSGLLEKPTIAVLPSGGQDASCSLHNDRLVKAITSGLASHRDIDVISGRSSRAVDPQSDTREAAAQLNADYVLECMLDPAENGLIGSFNLVNGKSGRHVWAQREDISGGLTVHDMEMLANKLVNALTGWQGELHLAEYRVAARKELGSLSAFEHFIRGCDLDMDFDLESVRHSLAHLDKALELDPNFARCLVLKSIMLQWSYDMYAEKDPDVLRQSQEAMSKALLLDPRDPLTLSLMALQQARDGDISGALDALRRAEPGCVGDADASVCFATAICVLCGDFDRSRQMFERGIALNPIYPVWYRFVEARLRFYFGEYQRSIAASRSGSQRVSSMVYRCLSHSMLGEDEASRAAYSDLLERYPEFDFTFYANYFPISHAAARARYQEAVDRLFVTLETEPTTSQSG